MFIGRKGLKFYILTQKGSPKIVILRINLTLIIKICPLMSLRLLYKAHTDKTNTLCIPRELSRKAFYYENL